MRAVEPRHPRGFTLIEVMVALVVIALGMLGVIQAVSQTASNSGYLRDKTIAHWVAMNRLTEVRLQKAAPRHRQDLRRSRDGRPALEVDDGRDADAGGDDPPHRHQRAARRCQGGQLARVGHRILRHGGRAPRLRADCLARRRRWRRPPRQGDEDDEQQPPQNQPPGEDDAAGAGRAAGRADPSDPTQEQ